MFDREKTSPYSYPLSMRHVLKFDSTIDQPDYYSEFCDVLISASEDDIVEMYFSTDGGHGSTMISLMNLMDNCRAKIIGYLLSDAHSAGSYLFLKCDEHFVGNHTSMLCHTVSYGIKGSHPEILDHVLHADKHEKALVKATYQDFLTEEEIDKLLNGKQIYLDADEIRDRLIKRNDILEERQEAQFKDDQKALAEIYADMEADLELPPDDKLEKQLTKKQLIALLKGDVDLKYDEASGKIELITAEE